MISSLLILSVLVADAVGTCDPDAKYRRSDGRCNNVDNEFWGAANQPYLRFAPAEYNGDDGSTPRLKGKDGADLPDPRRVSVDVHKEMTNIAKTDTVMVMQWGQFLDHDMTLTPKMESETVCCDGYVAGTLHSETTEGPCFPIGIPAGDRRFTSCMEFKRSKPIMDSNPREQINAITGFIDASAVYGSSDAETARLRDGGTGPYMKTRGDKLLPESTVFVCKKNDPTEWCFDAGDSRVNVFPGLSLLHTIFVRQHNRFVDELKKVQPDAEDEVLFQDARKIISALIQQITYDEYLPLVLGPDTMKKYKLGLDEDFVYNSSLNPTNFNVFATAALRFGHSAVPPVLNLRGILKPIENMFQINTELINDFEGVLTSMLDLKQEEADIFVTRGMTDNMFPDKKFDIASLNIQRGRDHGLPGYNAFRIECGLPSVTFDNDVFGNNKAILKATYDSPDDMDVFTGGLAEKHVRDGGVGPLFACLLGVQFQNVKFGDSYWYQTSDSNKGFTEDQLKEIRKINLSKLLCDNSKIDSIRLKSFKFTWFSPLMKVPCFWHPFINFSKWAPEV